MAKGHFARAARRPLKVPPDLADQVEALLARRLIDLLALARRAGEALAGLEKAKAAIVSGRGGAACSGRRRIGARDGRAARRRTAKTRCFVPFGRTNWAWPSVGIV